MRLIVDSLIAIMLLMVVAGVVTHYRQQQQQQADIQFVREALHRLRDQVVYRKALDDADKLTAFYPKRVQPRWFSDTLPLNVLVNSHHPWVDQAPAGDTAGHPPDPVVAGPDQAGFWYNPHNGIFRARVPRQGTRKETLALYNKVNGTNLSHWPGPGGPSFAGQREPEPVSFGRTASAAAKEAAQQDPSDPASLDKLTHPPGMETTIPAQSGSSTNRNTQGQTTASPNPAARDDSAAKSSPTKQPAADKPRRLFDK
jgi:hypothetical protein